MALKSQDKFLEEIGSMTVLELADLVKALEDKFGVSAAAPAAAAMPANVGAESSAAQEEKAEYKVTLKEVGSEKIKTIKALRQVVSGLALSDAKKMVEETPSVIAESASKDDAMKMKKELEAVGSKVELS